MNQYFRLSADCLLVEGQHDAALYDLRQNRLFLLDEVAHRLLRQCEDNQLVKWEELSPHARLLLQWLSDQDLAFPERQPVFIDKFLSHAPITMYGFAAPPPVLSQLDVSITTHCVRNCSFCPAHSETRSWQTCITCLRHPDSGASAVFLDYPQRLVEQAVRNGFPRLHLRGGDPFVESARLLAVVREAEQYPDLSLLITAPGHDQRIADVIALGAHPQVFLNIVLVDPIGSEAESGHGPSLLIKDLQRERIRFSLTVLLSGANGESCGAVERWTRSAFGKTPRFAEVRPGRQAALSACFPTPQAAGKSLKRWRTVDEFYSRVRCSTCLTGRMQLNCDGEVKPCVGVPDLVGITADGRLTGVLRSDVLYDWWEKDRNSASPCACCALRYACIDCCGVAFCGQGRSFCPYDPTSTTRAVDCKWQHDGFVFTLRAGGQGEAVCQRA
jgi:hypothetical protein